MKKEAEAKGKFTIGRFLNTAFNPFADVAGMDYYVPPETVAPTKEQRDNPTFPFTGDSTFDRLMFHGATAGVSMFALAALARMLVHKTEDWRSDKDKRKERAEAISAKSPIFSPDPDLTDADKEEALMLSGVQKEGVSKQADNLMNYLKVIVPLSAMVGGGYLGYKLVDDVVDRNRRKGLEAEIDRLSNEFDRLNYIKLLRARGLSDEEIQKELDSGVNPLAGTKLPGMPEQDPGGPMPKVAQDDEEDPGHETSGWTSLKSVAALLLLSTAVSSGLLAKKYFDSSDPRRIEMKEMEHALKVLKAEQYRKKPIDIAPIPVNIQSSLDAHLARKQKPAVIGSPELAARTIEETPVDLPSSGIRVDKSDPTMAIL